MAWAWTISSPETRRMWGMLVVVLLAVLTPTVCVLWFMNAAVANERLAVQQRLREVYQVELAVRQKRLGQAWEQVDAALEASQKKQPAAAFRDLVTHGGFTSALVFGQSGAAAQLQYPLMGPRPLDPQAQDAVALARAGVGAAHLSLDRGNPSLAVDLLAALQSDPHQRDALDAEGRALAPNALLLAITLLPPDDPRRIELATRLAARVKDDDLMTVAQRLFLMAQLYALTGEDFPTQSAEQWALYLAQIEPHWDDAATGSLRPVVGVPQAWIYQKFFCRAVFTAEDIQKRFTAVVQADAPAGTALALRSPGEKGEAFLTVPAGGAMADWHISLSLAGPDPFAAAARQRAVAYMWMAVLAVGTMALLAGILTVYLTRQMQLTRLKNDLIATVSHELKTPLSSMRVLVETLIEGRVPGVREQREYLDLIARENMRLSRLIDNFLTFSRMERQKTVFEFRPVKVGELVRSATAAIGERAGVVECQLPADLVVWGDGDALVTVLVNLLDNAWKYSPEPKRIALAASSRGGGVEILVRDWGVGIARRHQRRIFQRFYQIDRELSRRTGGCGLGLAIVDYIVRAHHGRVTVDSQVGKGSTFCVRLSACDAAGVPQDQPTVGAP